MIQSSETPQIVPVEGCWVVYYHDMQRVVTSVHMDLREAVSWASGYQREVGFMAWGAEDIAEVKPRT